MTMQSFTMTSLNFVKNLKPTRGTPNYSTFAELFLSIPFVDSITIPSNFAGLTFKNPLAIMCIKDQTPELCIRAVKDHFLALRYIKKQTPILCIEAVRSSKDAIVYVKELIPDLLRM
jgi:hypothetical protein